MHRVVIYRIKRLAHAYGQVFHYAGGKPAYSSGLLGVDESFVCPHCPARLPRVRSEPWVQPSSSHVELALTFIHNFLPEQSGYITRTHTVNQATKTHAAAAIDSSDSTISTSNCSMLMISSLVADSERSV